MIDAAKLQRIARGRQIENAAQLRDALLKVGLTTSKSQAVRIWNGSANATQTTMDSLCKALHCEQADIVQPVKRRRAS